MQAAVCMNVFLDFKVIYNNMYIFHNYIPSNEFQKFVTLNFSKNSYRTGHVFRL